MLKDKLNMLIEYNQSRRDYIQSQARAITLSNEVRRLIEVSSRGMINGNSEAQRRSNERIMIGDFS